MERMAGIEPALSGRKHDILPLNYTRMLLYNYIIIFKIYQPCIVKPYCTHLGYELSWNALEKTWDCPCHGSRYSYKGELLTEPSRKNLEILQNNIKP